MMLAVLIISAWLTMSGAILAAMAVGAAGRPIDGLDDATDDPGRIAAILVMAVLLVIQSIIWLVIGSTFGGDW